MNRPHSRAADARADVSRETPGDMAREGKHEEIHVKHAPRPLGRRAPRFAWLALMLVGLLALGCSQISSPDGWAAPVGDSELLIVHEGNGVLAGVELRDGGPPVVRWRFPADSDDIDFDGLYAEPILDGDRLYLFGYNGLGLALELSSSGPPRQVWAAPLDLEAHVVSTPILDGLQLYVTTDRGEVVTVDAERGQVLGRLALGESRIWSRALLDRGTLYVAGLDKRSLTAIAPGPQASVRWQRDTAGAVRSDLTLLGELMIVGTFDGTLHAYDIDADGAERWAYAGPDGGWFFAPLLPAGDRVYAATMRGGVYSLDRDGREIWTRELADAEIRVQPIIAGQLLIVADRNGTISGLDLTDGAEVWSREIGDAKFDAHPILVGSQVVFVTTSGELVSINPSNGAFQRFELGG
jgi:outer membrane protein assembly factor BamB